MNQKYSIVIPAYNEEGAVGALLEDLLAHPLKGNFEIIVVNDSSRDRTREVAEGYPVKVLSNVHNFGYGYSLKRGIREAKNDHIIILDADGSYPVSELTRLVDEYEKGYDMVVGARQGVHYRGSPTKHVARFFFRTLSEFATGRHIPDINSGYRVFHKDTGIKFFHTLSSGFSFTTTITLAFMLNSHSVAYIPVAYQKRTGKSKVHYVRDTLRSAQIIVEAIVLYNPIKIFMLCGIAVLLSGILAGIIGYFWPFYGLLTFMTLALTILVLALGLVCVLFKFTWGSQR